MKWVFGFDEAVPAEEGDPKNVLGGKGASLQEMTRAGLQVPPGFTLRTRCCSHFYEHNGAWPLGLQGEVRAHLARLEEQTGRTFGHGPRPLLVSVRSGAAVSMPGMMDTLLNCGLTPSLANELGDPPWFWPRYLQFIRSYARTVGGLKDLGVAIADDGPHGRAHLTEVIQEYEARSGKPFPLDPWEVLVACINAVFASWQSARAVAYRAQRGVRGLGTAVNVQAMWPSEVSGICFTQDPTSFRAERIVIESSYGLGEAVVSGDVAPDRFLVPRDRPHEIETHIGRKQCQIAPFGEVRERDPSAASLSPDQVRELVDLALRVERHYGHPVDLEWGWAHGRFALLQARPIRGLGGTDAETLRQEEIARLRQAASGAHKVWVAHNLGETLRLPTPMTWDVMHQFMSGSGGFGRMYQLLGYRPSAQVCREGFLELICGRIYADPDRLAALFWEGMPLRYDLEALTRDRSALDAAPNHFDAKKADGLFLLRLPGALWSMWRSARTMRKLQRTVKDRFENEILPPFLKYVADKSRQELVHLNDEQVRQEFDERCRVVLDEFGPQSLLPGFFGGLAFDGLQTQLVQLLGPIQGGALAQILTTALDGDITFEQDRFLYEIAHGDRKLDEFLDRFGHRALGEMELATPRWRENPGYLKQVVDRLRNHPGRAPADIHHQNLVRRQEAERDLPSQLADAGGSSLREDIEANLTQARELLPYREAGKHYLMMGYELLRQPLQELARRWDLGDDIYFLHREELARTDEMARAPHDLEALRKTAAERRLRWSALRHLDAPEVVDSNQLDHLGLPPPVEAASELSGAAMAPGVASGIARIVADPESAGDLGIDYVLVCASTDPGWTPLFLNARGLIVERGGVLSHGAIVARDFGIPAVARAQATAQLRDGDLVRVDGNQGRVLVIERRSADA